VNPGLMEAASLPTCNFLATTLDSIGWAGDSFSLPVRASWLGENQMVTNPGLYLTEVQPTTNPGLLLTGMLYRECTFSFQDTADGVVFTSPDEDLVEFEVI